MSNDNSDDLIEITTDTLTQTIENPELYKEMIIDILSEDPNPVSQEIKTLLKQNIINDELDMKLRALSTTVPYTFMIPLLRHQLGLCINTDKDCIESLRDIQAHLSDSTDQSIIDQIIDFIDHDQELDINIVPDIDLLGMIEKIPVTKFPALLNCVDYITDTTETIDS